MAEMSASIVNLKEAGAVAPIIFLFCSPVWPQQKSDGSWGMTEDNSSLTKWQPQYSGGAWVVKSLLP